MFPRFLTSFGSSSLLLPPLGRPPCLPQTFIRTSSLYRPRLPPAPPPCWSVRGFPPWPPQILHQVFPPQSLNTDVCSFPGGWRWVHTSSGLMMERPDRDRGPPPFKRMRSLEEEDKRRGPERGTDQNQDQEEGETAEPGKDGGFHPNQHHRDGDRKKTGPAERTKDRRGRGGHQWDGRRDPGRPGPDPAHRPNPWFRGRPPVETEEQRGRGVPGPWTRIVPGANREPGPPGHPQPVKPLHRLWEDCSTGPPPPGGGAVCDFSVMSYNILSQDLLQDNLYLYRHCDPAVLSWDFRLRHLLDEMRQHSADIMCLQEVQADHYQNQIKPALHSMGYHCEYKKRTGSKPDGCVVAFRSSRFSLVSSVPVEFFRRGDVLLDRDNVGQVLLLRPKDSAGQSDASSSSFLCVANTHLLYNPRRGDVKLAQLAILLAEISRTSRLPDGSSCPVVLCGDFNSTPWSPLYHLLTTGRLDYRGMQIGMVSGQENVPRGQRVLTSPIWSQGLGINQQCQYEDKRTTETHSSPTAVVDSVSRLSVDDLASKSAADVFNRSRLQHGLKLQSSYRHHLTDGRPEITTSHTKTNMTVDYILYTDSCASLPGGRGLQLLSRLSLVGQSELEEVGGLPNQNHPSDHLPLLVRFRSA